MSFEKIFITTTSKNTGKQWLLAKTLFNFDTTRYAYILEILIYMNLLSNLRNF